MRHTCKSSIRKSFGQLGIRKALSRSSFLQFCATTCLVVALCGPTAAEGESLDHFEEWKKNVEAVGAKVGNGTIQYDSVADQLSISEFSLLYSSKYEIIDTTNRYGLTNDSLFEKGIRFDLEVAADKAVLEGLKKSGDVTTIENTDFPDDLSLNFNLDFWGRGNLSLSMTFSGFKLKNSAYSKPAHSTAKGFGSELGMSQVVDFIGFDSFESGQTGLVEYRLNFNSEEESKFDLAGEFKNFEMSEFKDGIFQALTADNHDREFNHFSEEDSSNETESSSSEQIQIQELNLRSIFELFDSPAKRSKERAQVVKESSASRYLASGTSSTVKIDSHKISNLKWSFPDLDVLGIFSLFLMDMPIESTLLSVDLIRMVYAAELGEWSLKGMESEEKSETDGDDTVTYSIGEIRLKNLTGKGLGKFAISNLLSESKTEEGLLKIGELTVGDIRLAEYEEVEGFLEEVETEGSFPDDPVVSAKFLFPRSFDFKVSDVEFHTIGNMDTPQFNFKIGHLSKSFNSDIPPIPTDIVFEGRDIEFLVDKMEDTNMWTFLRNMGVETLNLSYNGRLYWNETAEELILEDLKFEITGLGEIEAIARVSGVKRSVLENPQELQIGMAEISFDHVKLKFIEKGIIQQFVKSSAENSNIPNSQAVEILSSVLKERIEEMISSKFAEHVDAELKKFLLDPKNLTLELKPDNPVSIIALIAGAAFPSTLPNLLNAEVRANQ